MEKLILRTAHTPGGEGGMANSGYDKSPLTGMEGSQKYHLRHSMLYYILHSLFTTTVNPDKKKTMPAITFKWIVGHLLFGGAYIYALIISILPANIIADIQLGDIKEPWKTVVIIFGLLWIAQRIYIGYQTGRSKQIENNERDYELKKKHLRDKK